MNIFLDLVYGIVWLVLWSMEVNPSVGKLHGPKATQINKVWMTWAMGLFRSRKLAEHSNGRIRKIVKRRKSLAIKNLKWVPYKEKIQKI